MKSTTQERSGALTAAVVSLMLICSGTSFSQNLGDAARQERERKQNLAQHATHVYTNDDLKKPEILAPEDRERILAARKNLNPPADQSAQIDAAADAKPSPTAPAPIVVANIAAIGHASESRPRVPVVPAHDRSPKSLPKFSASQAVSPRGAFLSPEIIAKSKHVLPVTPVAPVRENSAAAKVEKNKQASTVAPAELVAKKPDVAKVEQKKHVLTVAPPTPVAETSVIVKVQASKRVSTPVTVAPVVAVADSSAAVKVQTSKHIPATAAVVPAPVAQNSVVAKVEHKKQAPAVTPVIPVADNSVVAKVQTSKQVPSVVPVAPVAQNAVVAQAEKKQTVPSVAPAKPVTPVVNSFDVAKAQTSKLVPVAVSAAPVAKNSVVAKAGKKEHVPAVATVTPVAAVSAAPKVDKGEHVAAVAPATPVSGNSAVLATEKTASVTVIAVKQDADLATSDRVLVQKGDSLWKLAEKHLGNGARWPELAKLNPEISDPNIVRIGEWVRVSEEKRDPAKHEVVVQPGDTLSKVAQAEFGNARALRCIAEANPSLQAVDRIYPGETLILPPTCDVTR